jgi:hypothetical protein
VNTASVESIETSRFLVLFIMKLNGLIIKKHVSTIQGESKKPDTFDIQMNNKGVSFF